MTLGRLSPECRWLADTDALWNARYGQVWGYSWPDRAANALSLYPLGLLVGAPLAVLGWIIYWARRGRR